MDSNNQPAKNTQNDNRQDEALSFPVDITKQEFVRFNMIVSAVSGILRFKKGQVTLFAGGGIITLFMIISDILAYRNIDPVMVILLVFIAVSGGILMFGTTHHVRRSAERAYDQSRLNGRSYYGIITVYRDRIEKQSSRANISINLSYQAIYIETRDMMIFLAEKTPAVVIPARCLTSEDAEALRRTVLTAIPQTRQKIEAPLIPTAAGHISRPDDEPDNEEWRDENSISVEINYSRDEFVKIAADTALRGLLKLLPLYSFMSLMAALMFGLLYDFGFGIAVYVAVNAGLFLFRIFGARTRAGRAYDNMTSTRINVLLADKGIEVNSSEKSDRIKLEWKDVQRAVERPNDVEFFSESIFLRIPKRCIEDFDALRAFVDSHHQPTKK
jgi:hypothetical protein